MFIKKIRGCILKLYVFFFLSLTVIAKYCSPPPRVENAVVTTSYQKEYMPNSEVTYQCHHDFRMEVEGQDTIRCRNGNWEKKKIKCTRTYIQ